jgi:hypothetical protein
MGLKKSYLRKIKKLSSKGIEIIIQDLFQHWQSFPITKAMIATICTEIKNLERCPVSKIYIDQSIIMLLGSHGGTTAFLKWQEC